MQVTYPGGGATNNNYARIPNANLPSWITSAGSFTVRGWVRRGSGAGTAFRTVCTLANLFHVQISSGTGAAVRLCVHDNDSTTNCNATLEPANEEWIFFAGTWNSGTNAMVMVARSQSKARTAGTATFAPGGVTTRTIGDFFVGKNKLTTEGGGAGAVNAWDGQIGWLVISNEASTQAELEGMVDAAFTELSGQTGRYSPIIGLTYAGSGFAGVLGSPWFAPHGPISQEPNNGAGGARAGVAVTDTNWVWWNYNDASPTNAEFEAIVDENPTFDVVGSLTFADDDTSFFGLVPPGLTTNGNNGVRSTALARLRDNNPPAGITRVLCVANSRAVRNNYFADGPATYGVWSGNYANGLAASRTSKLAGCFNFLVSAGAWRRPFYDAAVGPASTGTFQGITSGTYNDFSRIWTNSLITASKGPGQGVRFGSAGATLTQRMTPLAGSLLDGTTQILHEAVFLEYPGSADGFDWEIEEGATAGDAGVDIDTGTETGLDTTAVTYTYTTATDSYNSGTPNIVAALPSADQAEIANLLAAGHLVGVYVSAGTGVGSIAQVLSITPGATATITLKHAFNTAIVNGDTLKFGRVGFRVLRTTQPIPGNTYQGWRITANAGLIWLSVGCEAVGVSGWSVGTAGHGGNGYPAQISDAWTGLYGKMAQSLGIDAAFLFVAGQDSAVPDDREEYATLLGLPTGSCILASDPVHRVVDNQTVTWAEDSLAQTIFPAVVSTESCGSLIAAYSRSYKHNITHPSIEQYKLVFDTIWTEAAGIQAERAGASRGRGRGRGRRSAARLA